MFDRRRIIPVIVVLLSVPAFADRLPWTAFYGGPHTLRAGKLECVQEVRSMASMPYTKMTLTCSREGKTLFVADDFADVIAASDDGRYIVGFSSRPYDNLFWIRDAQGKMLDYRSFWSGPHQYSGVHYCVTGGWFNQTDPDVKFQIKDGKLMQVTVNSCDGKELRLPGLPAK
jgi:hypothetical protein